MNNNPNKKQQICIDKKLGKYLVLAGPGTGKTYTVSKRIKSIIQEGFDPKRILCLTFSNTAANEMKTKINKELNSLDCGITISTYHSFCKTLIDNDKDIFEINEDFKIITDQTAIGLVKNCIDEYTPTYFMTSNNDPYFHIKTIINGINQIKANRFNKESFEKALNENPDWLPELKLIENDDSLTDKKRQSAIEKQEKKIEKARELFKYYELYQQKMNKYKYIDFSDLISMVLDKFENDENYLISVAKNYDHILVDEFQDTNLNQNKIVEYLAKKIDNVFVVGDDDQIIYSFQGARLDTMHRYIENFKPEVICLDENRRSSQNILDASRIVSQMDPLRLEGDEKFREFNISKKLNSVDFPFENKKIKVTPYIDLMQEKISIVEEIKKIKEQLKKENKKLSEIAIILTTNNELKEYFELLKNANIPCELKEGKSIFEIRSVIAFIYYLQFLTNPEYHQDKLLKLLLLEPFNINPIDYDLISKNKTKEKSLIDYLLKDDFDYSIFNEPNKIKKIIEDYKYLKSIHSSLSLKDTLLTIGAKTGIFEYYFNSGLNQMDNILGIKKLIEESQDFFAKGQIASLEDFIEHLEMAYSQKIEIKTEKSPVELDAIQLTTYHSSKGREFEYVFMPNLIKSLWEDKKPTNPIIPTLLKDYKNENQRQIEAYSDRIKNFFVGMTRAKHTLYLSYPTQNQMKAPISPSDIVLNMIETALKEEKDIFEISELQKNYTDVTFKKYLTKTFTKESYDYKKDFKDLINSKLPQSFSPTALNLYLKCPRQYLFERILNLSTKSGNTDALNNGNAVHYVLKYAFDYAKENNKYPDVNQFIELYNNEIDKLPISTYEKRQELKNNWKETLIDNGFYTIFTSTPISRLQEAEIKVEGTLKDGSKIYGVIDRIEKNDDGSLTICDYKTSKSKLTKTYICPEREHEDYYNQIGLYKILYEQMKNNLGENLKVKNLKFIFTQAPTKPVEYEMTVDELNNLEDKIIQIINSIKNQEFEPIENKDTTYGDCSRCPYMSYCGLDIVH